MGTGATEMTRDPIEDGPPLPLEVLDRIDSICIEFENAWQAAAPPKLDDYVSQLQGAARSELLCELLRLELDYHSRRQQEMGLNALQHRFPEHAGMVAQLFDERDQRYQDVDRARDEPQGDLIESTARGDPTLTLVPGSRPDRRTGQAVAESSSGGRRFVIKRLHAKGGLGQVFVAHDLELNRDVALKEIQQQHAHHAIGRARFLLEAEVTGRLEHPGIVPVYGAGCHADGRPFYAMRFIRGSSLRQAITRYHTENTGQSASDRTITFRQLLRRFLDVCQTVEYAHSRGVLHRDLKPSNIMLGEYGETLIVDWGLAKVMRDDDTQQVTPVSDESPLLPNLNQAADIDTAIGTTLGTPAYMSPEQAAGQMEELSPACDIYSLGATLYAILTGDAPFAKDKVADVLDRVRAGRFAAPRSRRPQVPRELEAVCLKAMARDPKERYGSALQLADDIEAWLADETVSAYRTPVVDRVRRWGRRHRTSVLVTLAAVIVAMLVAAVGNVLLAAKNSDLRAANAREEIAKDQAERRFDLAMRAVEDYYTGVSRQVILRQPGFQHLRQTLLKKPLLFYDELRESLEKEQTPESRAALANAYLGIGTIDNLTGSSNIAAASFHKAKKLFYDLSLEYPDVARYQLGLAKCYASMGTLENDLSRPREALQNTLRAIETANQLVLANPNVPEYRGHLATYHKMAGVYQKVSGRLQEAMESYRLAAQIGQELVRASDDANFQKELAGVYNNIGLLHRDSKEFDTAIKYFELAEVSQLELLKQDPENSGCQLDLAELYNNLSYLYRAMEQPGKALEECLKSGRFREKLAGDYPNVPDYQEGLATHHHLLANMQRQVGQQQKALLNYQQAIDLLEQLGQMYPLKPRYQDLIADNFQNLGSLRRDMGDKEAAIEDYRAAERIREQLAADHPIVEFQRARVRLLGGFGLVLEDLDERSEALQKHQKAVQVLEDLIRDFPDVDAYQIDQIQCLRNCGQLQLSMQQPLGAKASYEMALQLCRELAGKNPHTSKHQSDTAKTLDDLGRLHKSLGQWGEAVTCFEEAIQLNRELIAADPDIVAYQRNMAAQCHDLSSCYQRRKDIEAALASCKRAVQLRSELAKSGAPDFKHDYASSLNALGVLHQEHGNVAEAIRAVDQAIAIEESVSDDDVHDPVFLAGCYCNRGHYAVEMDNAVEALDWYDIALKQLQPIIRQEPQNARVRRYARNTIIGRVTALINAEKYDEAISQCDEGIAMAYGASVVLRLFRQQALVSMGDHRGATSDAEFVMKEARLQGPALYDLARVFSLSVEAAKLDPDLDDEDKRDLSERYTAQAIALLEKARELGYFSQPSAASRLAEDPDLDTIRSHTAFERFVQQLAKPPR
jgi:serine/threonine protein kinase